MCNLSRVSLLQGLNWLINRLFTVLQCCYTIFNMCIADPLESSFLKVYNHKYKLIGTIKRYLTTGDEFSSIYRLCHKCDSEWHTLLLKSIGCFVNILLK